MKNTNQPRYHRHADEALEAIDHYFDEPPVDIHTALSQAVEAGRMTQEEARQCYDAYCGVFHPDENLPNTG